MILNVPYFGQWQPDALRYREDCGPTCCKQIIAAYTGRVVPVDRLSAMTSLFSNDIGLPPSALVKLLAAYGLKSSLRQITQQSEIATYLDAGRPIIALLSYGYVSERMDPFRGGHFVSIVGCDDKGVLLHDPDWWGGNWRHGAYLPVRWDEIMNAIAHSPIPGQCVVMEDSLMSADTFSQLAVIVAQTAATKPTAKIAVSVAYDDTPGETIPAEYGGDVADFLSVFAIKPPAPTNQGITTSAGVNLRAGPGTSYAYLVPGGLRSGTAFTVLTDVAPKKVGSYTWIHVQLVNGTQGYIAREFTSLK